MRNELGIVCTPNSLASAAAGSKRSANSAGTSARKPSASARSLSRFTAMICRPAGPYLRCIEFNHGNERRHGTHQDAQKSTQTTRPSTGASADGGAARATAARPSKKKATDSVNRKRTVCLLPRIPAVVRRAAPQKSVAERSTSPDGGRRSRNGRGRGGRVLRVVTPEPLRLVGAVTAQVFGPAKGDRLIEQLRLDGQRLGRTRGQRCPVAHSIAAA